VEGTSKRGDQLTGRTATNKIVNIDRDYNMIGKIVKVLITDAFLNSLRGKSL
jgi:tRNA A37 methylthiotransferase MiaB